MCISSLIIIEIISFQIIIQLLNAVVANLIVAPADQDIEYSRANLIVAPAIQDIEYSRANLIVAPAIHRGIIILGSHDIMVE